MDIPIPKVFISYSWSAQDWVVDLANRLVSESRIDVVLDVWDLEKGQDKYHFMERMVNDTSISKVLMICDEKYAAKANSREGGVGDETQIITPALYGAVSQDKFIPIIRERGVDGKEFAPHYLKTRVYIDLSYVLTFEEGCVELVRTIYGKLARSKPALAAAPPSFILEDNVAVLPTTYKLRTFQNALMNSKPQATGMAEDYLVALDQALEPLEIVLTDGAEITVNAMEQRIQESIAGFLPLRNEFINFMVLISKYGDSVRLFEGTQRFFYQITRYLYRHHRPVQGEIYADNYTFLIPELFLYAIAVLVKYGRYDEANIFLGATYQDSSNRSRNTISDYTTFIARMEHVDQWASQWQAMIPERDGTPTSRLLKERAQHADISFRDLTDVDYALFVRSMLNPADARWFNYWRPNTFIDALWTFNSRFSLFERATSHNDFRKLCRLLNVEDKIKLLAAIDAAYARGWPSLNRMQNAEQHKRFMNLANLDSM